MFQCLIVACGGAIGSVFRYLIGLMPLGSKGGFPINTFIINVIGAFAIGLVAASFQKNGHNETFVLFLKVGVCGGFTTFSSFALETEQLVAKGDSLIAALYVILSVLAGVGAVILAEKIV